jgi:hypothetical protein
MYNLGSERGITIAATARAKILAHSIQPCARSRGTRVKVARGKRSLYTYEPRETNKIAFRWIEVANCDTRGMQESNVAYA